MVLMLRKGARRVIVNERELLSSVLPRQPRLKTVVFERLPVSEQMLVASTAVALIGVHGAGLLGYTIFLPTDVRNTACVEIRPRATSGSSAWQPLVKKLARSAGVHFEYMVAKNAPGCPANEHYEMQRNCTTGVCRRKIQRTYGFEGMSVLWCNVTVDPDRLMPLIERAASHTAPSNVPQTSLESTSRR